MISSPSSPYADTIQKFALEINSVHKSFGQVDVLKGVDLKLDVGERVALMGPSWVPLMQPVHQHLILDRPL